MPNLEFLLKDKNGNDFVSLRNQYTLKSGNYCGDMVGIYIFNNIAEAGYVDVDWFHYEIKNK